jgi:hypothetical protein
LLAFLFLLHVVIPAVIGVVIVVIVVLVVCACRVIEVVDEPVPAPCAEMLRPALIEGVAVPHGAKLGVAHGATMVAWGPAVLHQADLADVNAVKDRGSSAGRPWHPGMAAPVEVQAALALPAIRAVPLASIVFCINVCVVVIFLFLLLLLFSVVFTALIVWFVAWIFIWIISWLFPFRNVPI